MFTLVAPQSPVSEDKEDFLLAYGDYAKRIELVDITKYDAHIDQDAHAVVPLTGMHCGYHPWRSLTKFGLDAADVQTLMDESANVCPITGLPYNALLPRAIHFLSPEDPSIAALAQPGFSFLFQPGFVQYAMPCYGSGEGPGLLSLDDVEHVLLGSGYTEGMLPYDGFSEFVSARIPLAIGSSEPAAYLLCAARMWFNK